MQISNSEWKPPLSRCWLMGLTDSVLVYSVLATASLNVDFDDWGKYSYAFFKSGNYYYMLDVRDEKPGKEVNVFGGENSYSPQAVSQFLSSFEIRFESVIGTAFQNSPDLSNEADSSRT